MTAGAWQEVRRHPVAETVARLHAELDAVAESSVWSMSHREFTETLTGLTRLAARVAELELRVAAHAERREVGAHMGASTAGWWAHSTRLTRAEANRSIRLARALEEKHEPVRDALAAGDLLADQAG